MTARLLALGLAGFATLSVADQPAEAPTPTVEPPTEYSYGLHLFSSGDYYRAIGAFQRHLYFHAGDGLGERARYMIGLSYFAAGRYGQAIEAFHALREDIPAGPLRTDLDYYIARSWDSSGNRELARLMLADLAATDSGSSDDIALALGWSFAQDHNWRDAASSFGALQVRFPESQFAPVASDLQRNLEDPDNLARKSPTLAAVLSLAPGGGQLYAGRHADAVYSLLLIGSAVALAARGNDLGSNATRVGVFVAVTLYVGNLYGGVNAALRYNLLQDEALLDRVRERLQETSIFLLPAPEG